jgi:DDE family transposase
MTPDPHVDWRQVVSRIAEPAALDASARACGAIQRSRKVRDGETLLRLGLIWGPGGQGLRMTAALAEAGGIAAMSDVAVMKRLRQCAGWFEQLCGEVLARRLGRSGGGADQRAIRIVDGTRIAGPGRRAWRLHLCYDVTDGRLSDFALTDTSGGERLERLAIRAGEIRLGDRGLAKPTGLAAVRDAGADFVVRCTWNSLSLSFPGKKTFAWQPLFAEARTNGLVDTKVLVNKARAGANWTPVPARLILWPKSPQAAARSRDTARQDSRRDQHRIDPRTLAAADFVILVTSLPADAYPAHRVLELYRLRWQIEIAIKRLKSLIHIDRLPAKDPDLVRTWLLGHLLFALAVEAVEDETAESPP